MLTLRLEQEAAPAGSVGEALRVEQPYCACVVGRQRLHRQLAAWLRSSSWCRLIEAECTCLLCPPASLAFACPAPYPAPPAGVAVEVKGLLGGHSGINIHEDRGG